MIKLDLLQPGAQKLLFSIFESERLLFVWLSPPNGNAPASQATKKSHVEGNSPNTIAEPGFEDYSANVSDQAGKIAHLQDLSCTICVYLSQAGKPWSVACSSTSGLWSTQAWQVVVELCQPAYTCFQSCMYGGSRPKRMTLAFANMPELSCINSLCDGSHEHDTGVWGRSAPKTSSVCDSFYPRKLCTAVATAVHANCLARGIQDMPLDLQSVPGDIAMDEVAARAMAGSSAAQRQLPGLMPEYRVKLTVTLPLSDIAWQAKDRIRHFLRIGDVLIPPNSRLLAIIPTTDGDVHARQCIFGVPWKPHEFVQEAALRGFPNNFAEVVPDELEEAILNLATQPHHVIVKRRSDFFRRWLSKAADLHSQEEQLKASFDLPFASVVRSKRILLFEEMVREYSLADKDVASILKQGVDLAGKIPLSNDLPKSFSPPHLSLDELEELTPLIREAAIARAEGTKELVEETWDKTVIEAEKGWLSGPFDPESPEAAGLLSNRFGVMQKGKIRCVDDMSASLINATTFAEEKITLHNVDVICAAIGRWYQLRQKAGLPTKLLAKSFDLKSAYKQLPIASCARRHAGLALSDPKGRCKVFRSISLPFGATQSVFSFNRMSRAVWAIAAKGLWLMWTCFYDDFPIFSEPGLESNTDQAAETFFTLLGWAFDKEGDKHTSFSAKLSALGVIVNLSPLSKGMVEVLNTEARVSELIKDLLQVTQDRQLSQSRAKHLAERMSFAGCQVFGRLAKSCLRVFHDEALAAIKAYCDILKRAPARQVSAAKKECFYLYTDASLEEGENVPCAGLGGVIVDPTGLPLQFFSWFPEQEDMTMLGIDLGTKCIFLLELLAVCIGFWLWGDVFGGSSLVAFTDNEAAKACLVKGSSAHPIANKLLFCQAVLEVERMCLPWFSRVPSPSNIADGPSRKDGNEPLLEGVPLIDFNFAEFLVCFKKGESSDFGSFQ